MDKSKDLSVDGEPDANKVEDAVSSVEPPSELTRARSDALGSDSEEEREPSHKMDGDYVILMETNGKELESWYNCIRVEGNEAALEHLQTQLEKVDWYIIDDLSTFDLDLDHKISARTAKELTKIELNAVAFHRKFDGKLRKINLL